MRIGIDCRPLIKEKTGIGYYLWEILNEWAKQKIEHELLLFAPRDFQIPPALEQSNVRFHKRIVQVRPAELWMHTVLPWQLAIDNVDIYWGPNYAMPIWPIPIPAVLTIHDTVYKEFPETMKTITLWHNRLGLETYVKNCCQVIVPSVNTQNDVIRHLNVAESRISVIPLGVSDRISMDARKAEQLLVQFGLTAESYFLTVCTLEPRKNLNRVIRAFQQVQQSIPDAQLAVVGTKGWGTTSDEVIQEVSLNIHYLGYVSDEQLAALYQKAKAFVYVPLYEGFGLPPLEAMRAAAPVLVSKSSSLPEVVGDAGLYADPCDTDEIAFQMNRLWREDLLREELVSRGIQRASQMTWSKTAMETLRILEKTGRGE